MIDFTSLAKWFSNADNLEKVANIAAGYGNYKEAKKRNSMIADELALKRDSYQKSQANADANSQALQNALNKTKSTNTTSVYVNPIKQLANI